MEINMGYIYKITNLINNKIYVGQTRFTINKRFQQHIYQAGKRQHSFPLYRAMQKYGVENFIIEPLEEIQDETLLNEREIYWIKKLDSYIKNNKGYNSTYGGEGNPIIDKLEVFLLWDQGLSVQEIANQLNHDRSSIRNILQTYEKYSIDQSNKRGDLAQAKNRFKKIEQYSLSGEYLATYYNMTEAERQTKVSHKNIWGAANHKQKTAGGFQWCFEEDPDKPKNISKKATGHGRKVQQINIQTNQVIHTFNNAKEASQQTKVKIEQIRRTCRGQQKTSGGYKWKYL